MLFGAVVLTTLIFGGRALAQDSLLVQNKGRAPVTGVPRPGETKAHVPDADYAKLSRLDIQSEPYRARLAYIDDDERYSPVLEVFRHGVHVAAIADVCRVRGCNTRFGMPDYSLMFSVDRHAHPNHVDLTPLANAYKAQTGRDLQYVKLIAEDAVAPSLGGHIVIIHIVATDTKDGNIFGMPATMAAFTLSDNQVTFPTPVAMVQ